MRRFFFGLVYKNGYSPLLFELSPLIELEKPYIFQYKHTYVSDCQGWSTHTRTCTYSSTFFFQYLAVLCT